MDQLQLPDSVLLREIKSKPLEKGEVDRLAKKAGSYEALFSRRARKYREYGLHEKELTETDYRQYLLDDYTFLKRPVLELSNIAIAGNSKGQVTEMAKHS